jgi:hypothetical protein
MHTHARSRSHATLAHARAHTRSLTLAQTHAHTRLTEGFCNRPVDFPGCSCAEVANPVFSYNHKFLKVIGVEGWSASVTGGFVYRGNSYPAEWKGRYFYGDYQQGWVRYLNFNAQGVYQSSSDFDLDWPNLKGIINMVQGPDGNLWIAQFSHDQYNPSFAIRRYVFNSQATTLPPPVITSFSANPKAGTNVPMTVNFVATVTSAASSVEILWDFGDGVTQKGVGKPGTFTITRQYPNFGVFLAQFTAIANSLSTLSTKVE